MAADKLTLRADGKFVANIYVGSRAVMMADETFRRGTPNTVARENHMGRFWTEKVTLLQSLQELVGYERAATLYAEVKDADEVTIRDEYTY